jgi:hypothetical protein
MHISANGMDCNCKTCNVKAYKVNTHTYNACIGKASYDNADKSKT